VARLRVPGHGVDLIVLAGVSARTLAFGPGHAAEGIAPGAAGTVIVTGHRDTHFRFLARLQRGDEIVLEMPQRLLARYRVREAVVVDARVARIRNGDDSLVLLTCYRFHAVTPHGPLRYVVTADHVVTAERGVTVARVREEPVARGAALRRQLVTSAGSP
jgi:sortase A